MWCLAHAAHGDDGGAYADYTGAQHILHMLHMLHMLVQWATECRAALMQDFARHRLLLLRQTTHRTIFVQVATGHYCSEVYFYRV